MSWGSESSERSGLSVVQRGVVRRSGRADSAMLRRIGVRKVRFADGQHGRSDRGSAEVKAVDAAAGVIATGGAGGKRTGWGRRGKWTGEVDGVGKTGEADKVRPLDAFTFWYLSTDGT